MYIDYETKLSSDQVVVGSAASDNYIDLSVATRDISQSEPLFLMVQVTDAATSSGSATVTFSLENDDGTDFSGATTVYTSIAIPKATLVDNYQFFVPLPQGITQRYLRGYYTVGTANLSAGSFTMAIVDKIQKSAVYAGA